MAAKDSNGATADKALQGDLDRVVRRTVIETDSTQPIAPQGLGLIYLVAGAADDIRPWGTNPTLRDKQLREFMPMETFTASAIATVVARNMAFGWKIDGPEAVVAQMQDILHNSDMGRGWASLIAKFSLDLYSQDKGGFLELVREEDTERAPVIGLNHLDASRCWHTRNPEFPVLYQNDKGRWLALKWYQVLALAELPAPHERLVGLQYSALTRILRTAQIFRNIAIYQDEKTGGRSPRSLHILGNVKEQAIRDAITKKQLLADAQGLLRYIDPVLVETFDPEHPPSVTTLDFASIPDGFKLEEMFKWYIAALAMGLLTDYQEFAPLPGGNLGTASQSQVQNMKSRGKGAGIFQQLLTHAFNFRGVMPRNCTFMFDEDDLEEEQVRAELRLKRAEARGQMVQNGELDAIGSMQLALDEGDMPQELFDVMSKRPDLTQPVAQDTHRVANDEDASVKARLSEPKRAGPDEERLALEEEVAAKLGEGFARVREKIERRLARV